MARFRPVDPPTASKDRPLMKHKDDGAVTADEFGEDPWVLAARRNAAKDLSMIHSSSTAHTSVKPTEAEDDVALPTPIGQGAWKVTAPDGREELTYEPIKGFEHLLRGQDASQRVLNVTRSPTVAQRQQSVAATSSTTPQRHVPATALQRKMLKRSRSVTRASKQRHNIQTRSNVDDDDDDDDDREEDDVMATNEVLHSFYVGDFSQLKKFFRRRLDELTMKPLRPIVTAWIKQLEPKRLGFYGPYHKRLPGDMPPQCTPQWWPRDVHYEEPSHLGKAGLLTLAVDVMLQHRSIDEPKRRGSWVAKLWQAAQYAIETTAPEHFSSAKRVAFSEQMRDRALKEILPTLFHAAQSYEDHLAQYDLYEGTGNVDPGVGTQIYWSAASKPARMPTTKRRAQRVRAAKTKPIQRADYDESTGNDTEIDDTLSNSFMQKEQEQARKRAPPGDETEVDDTISNTFLRKERFRARKRPHLSRPSGAAVVAELPSPVNETITTIVSRPQLSETQTPAVSASASQPNLLRPHNSNLTPNSSFNHSMNRLGLGENMESDMKLMPAHHSQYEVDMKNDSHQQYTDQGLLYSMFPPNQPIQYSSSHPAHSQQAFTTHEDLSSFSGTAHSVFSPGPSPGFISHFPMYTGPYVSHIGASTFAPQMMSNNPAYPYGFEEVFPPTPTPTADNTSFNTLPADAEVHGKASPHH